MHFPLVHIVLGGILASVFVTKIASAQIGEQDAFRQRVRVLQPMEALNVRPARVSPFALERIAQAKLLYEEEEQQSKVVFLVERYRTENKTKIVKITRQRIEKLTRTRTVDGKEVEEEFQITVPFQEEVERRYTLKVPAGKKPVAVPLAKVKFFEMDGTEADLETVASRLKTLKPVFLHRVDPQKTTIQPAEILVQQIVKPGTLLAVTAALDEVPVP